MLPEIVLPSPADAQAWFDFVVQQQAATYAGIVPEDFADHQREWRDEGIQELAAGFTDLEESHAAGPSWGKVGMHRMVRRAAPH